MSLLLTLTLLIRTHSDGWDGWQKETLIQAYKTATETEYFYKQHISI